MDAWTCENWCSADLIILKLAMHFSNIAAERGLSNFRVIEKLQNHIWHLQNLSKSGGNMSHRLVNRCGALAGMNSWCSKLRNIYSSPSPHIFGKKVGFVRICNKVSIAWSEIYESGCLHIHGLVQGCSISSALAMEILQSCTKPSTCNSDLSCTVKLVFILLDEKKFCYFFTWS